MYSKCTVHTCTRIVVKLLLHMYEGNTHVTGLQLYNVYLLYVHSYESTFKVQLLSFVHESSIVCTCMILYSIT